MRPVLRVFVIAALCSAASFAQGVSLGSAQNLLFPGGNNLAPLADTVALAPDGSWAVALGSSAAADFIVYRIENGVATGVQSLNLPSGVGVSASNGGISVAPDSSFAATLGSGGLFDLIVVRRGSNGSFQLVGVDYPQGPARPLNTRARISPGSDYVVSIGAGGSADLVFTPITRVGGLASPGLAILVSAPGGNEVPGATGVQPEISPNGRNVAVAGTQINGDLIVAQVPQPFAAPLAYSVAFPNGINSPTLAAPLRFSPDARYLVAHGSPTLGDLVFLPFSNAGTPQAPWALLFPSSANALDTATPPLIEAQGRVVALRGTLTTADLILIPVNSSGQPGLAQNLAFPGGAAFPNDAPEPEFAASGRVLVAPTTSPSADILVIRPNYDAALNTVSPTATSVAFPGNGFRRGQTGPALAPDGSFVVTQGATGNTDLFLTAIDEQGLPTQTSLIVHPSANNGVAGMDRVMIHPASDGFSVLGVASTADVISYPVIRDAMGRSIAGSAQITALPSNNNINAALPRGYAPSGEYFFASGSPTVGDLVLIPVTGMRTYTLDPPRPGSLLRFLLSSPADPSRPFVAAASLNRFPTTPLGDGRVIELTSDFVLSFSLAPGNGVFLGMGGLLDASGLGLAAFAIPNDPALIGLPFYFAFLTLDPAASLGVGRISTPIGFVIE